MNKRTTTQHSLASATWLLALVVACTSEKTAEYPEPPAATDAPPVVSATESTNPPVSTGEIAPSASASVSVAPDPVAAAVAAADRSDADRALDAGRKPEELLKFCDVKPGMQVAELAAGGGYTAELLNRVVGVQGKVYGQNSPLLLKRYAEVPWTERLSKPINANIVRLDRDFDAPLPPEVKNLDAVFLVLFYHDTVWMKTDRPKMNRNIYDALKPGGVFCVVDHSAKPGEGLKQVEKLHRIEEPVLLHEVEAAGFKKWQRGDFLANPADKRDWSASPRFAGEQRGTSDRFVYKFVKE